MITSVSEIDSINRMIIEVKDELDGRKVAYGRVRQGIMIETPAAVMISDMLAEKVDFFSIGTNDLTQYTLAMDRQNAGLAGFMDTHHPAVLRMIEMTVDNAHRNNVKVGICGELGADPDLTGFFIKTGVDELSVPVPRLLDLRRHIRELE
jgi:phosphotransferase system enzyme I (PtsI)